MNDNRMINMPDPETESEDVNLGTLNRNIWNEIEDNHLLEFNLMVKIKWLHLLK